MAKKKHKSWTGAKGGTHPFAKKKKAKHGGGFERGVTIEEKTGDKAALTKRYRAKFKYYTAERLRAIANLADKMSGR